jgi:glycosyltransferase involved in cell wall biosynthesis
MLRAQAISSAQSHKLRAMFSVVIPVYNHAPYLAEAVQSSLASSLVSEVLVCDDGSSDASAEILRTLARSDPRVRNVTDNPQSNAGAHNRLNQLCHLAQHEYLAVLNSDDRFVPGRFDICAQLIRRYNVDFICGHLLIMDGQGTVFGTKRGVLEPEYPYPADLDLNAMIRSHDVLNLLASQNFIATTSNMVFTRTLHRAVGGFADLRYAHDYDFALRAAILGRCHYTPHFLTTYRVHATNTITEGGSRQRVIAELQDIFQRLLRDFPFLRQRDLFMRLMRERPTEQHFELVA